MRRKLILEDGQEYYGTGFGSGGERVLELVFNTSMAGYQEILSDPSYTGQAVVLTYPLIGSYGMAAEDYESQRPTAGAIIVHHYNPRPSGSHSVESLEAAMVRFNIPGLSGVDTRRLTRSIRDRGSRKALLTDADTPLAAGLALLERTALPRNVVAQVSCPSAYTLNEGGETHVAVLDCGVKGNILRSLTERGCRVTVLPWSTPAGEVLALGAAGVLVSNGPGDPQDVPETIAAVQGLLGRLPVLGICLGHQILSLACGAKTYKLKFGHRGGNHPVRELASGNICFTAQNHSYAVDAASLQDTPLHVTHVNLLDGTVEGVAWEQGRAFGVQFHPESAPGPQECGFLFDRFVSMTRGGVDNAQAE